MTFPYHLMCICLPSSCMNSVTILGRRGWEQAVLQVLFRYKPGTWTIVKLSSCKLVLSVVYRLGEFDVIYPKKSAQCGNTKTWGFFYLHSDPLPISSMGDSRQRAVRVRAFSCSGLGTFMATFPPETSLSSSSHSFPHCCSLNQKWTWMLTSQKEGGDWSCRI